METKEGMLKMENSFGCSSFADYISGGNYPLQGVFDFIEGDKSSLGFMDLLGVQDHFNSSLFDMGQPPATVVPSSEMNQVAAAAMSRKMEPTEASNPPATPNSSSISSASSEAVNDEKKVEEDQEEDQKKTTKQ